MLSHLYHGLSRNIFSWRFVTKTVYTLYFTLYMLYAKILCPALISLIKSL
jgi:hypothetical protein